MREITLTADEALIERANERAKREQKSLNEVFQQWLEQYAPEPPARIPYEEVMRRLAHIRSAGPYTRDEMNER